MFSSKSNSKQNGGLFDRMVLRDKNELRTLVPKITSVNEINRLWKIKTRAPFKLPTHGAFPVPIRRLAVLCQRYQSVWARPFSRVASLATLFYLQNTIKFIREKKSFIILSHTPNKGSSELINHRFEFLLHKFSENGVCS